MACRLLTPSSLFCCCSGGQECPRGDRDQQLCLLHPRSPTWAPVQDRPLQKQEDDPWQHWCWPCGQHNPRVWYCSEVLPGRSSLILLCIYVVPTVTPSTMTLPHGYCRTLPCRRTSYNPFFTQDSNLNLLFTGAVLFSCCEQCLWQAWCEAIPDSGCIHQWCCGKAGFSRRNSALQCLQNTN